MASYYFSPAKMPRPHFQKEGSLCQAKKKMGGISMEEREPNCMRFGVQCEQGAIEKPIKDMTIMEGAVFPFVKSGMIS